MKKGRSLKQIWRDLKCAIGCHDFYKWRYFALYKNVEVTNCYNCHYRKEVPVKEIIKGKL